MPGLRADLIRGQGAGAGDMTEGQRLNWSQTRVGVGPSVSQ